MLKKQINALGALLYGAIIGISGFSCTSKNEESNLLDIKNKNEIVLREENNKKENVLNNIKGKLKRIDDYVEIIVDLSTDNSKRTVYFILQSHNIDGFGHEKSVEDKFRRDVSKNQISIYRIVENLYNEKGLQIIINEGMLFDDRTDIDNPFYFKEVLDSKKQGKYEATKRLLESGADKILETVMINTGIGGAELFGRIYDGLCVLGFEEKNTYEEGAYLMRRLNTRDLSREERKETFRQFLENSKKRSDDALKYALEYSDELFNLGHIKNKNVAIVSGEMHLRDYGELIKKLEVGEELSYNLVFITPKGSLYNKLEEELSKLKRK